MESEAETAEERRSLQKAAEQSAEQSFLDEVVEASFPASDPPAVWTWDVEPAPEE
jgi:hypothetical protein